MKVHQSLTSWLWCVPRAGSVRRQASAFKMPLPSSSPSLCLSFDCCNFAVKQLPGESSTRGTTGEGAKDRKKRWGKGGKKTYCLSRVSTKNNIGPAQGTQCSLKQREVVGTVDQFKPRKSNSYKMAWVSLFHLPPSFWIP